MSIKKGDIAWVMDKKAYPVLVKDILSGGSIFCIADNITNMFLPSEVFNTKQECIDSTVKKLKDYLEEN
jgi:hypothetical protein